MSSMNSVGGNSASSSANLYQLMMQELQTTSIGTSISTQSSLSASLAVLDQILFSPSSLAAAGTSSGDGAGTSPDAALSNPLQQYLADVYGNNSGS